jgi:hypothetical protein
LVVVDFPDPSIWFLPPLFDCGDSGSRGSPAFGIEPVDLPGPGQ